MKVVLVPCSCGMKGCVTELILGDDEEVPKNTLFTIRDEKHEYASFISLDHDDAQQIVDFLRKRYKLGKGM